MSRDQTVYLAPVETRSRSMGQTVPRIPGLEKQIASVYILLVDQQFLSLRHFHLQPAALQMHWHSNCLPRLQPELQLSPTSKKRFCSIFGPRLNELSNSRNSGSHLPLVDSKSHFLSAINSSRQTQFRPAVDHRHSENHFSTINYQHILTKIITNAFNSWFASIRS